MGVSSSQSADARHRAVAGGTADRRTTRADWPGTRFARAANRLIAALLLLVAATAACADQLRIAVFAAPFSRAGPGLLLRDLLAGDDPQLGAALDQIAAVAPDILLLTAVDYDAGGAALDALRAQLAARGLDYPTGFARLPNSGMTTGLDMDGDGWRGGARDAQGYGSFAGQAGLAILSRWPVDTDGMRDFSDLLWRDLPDATLPMVGGAPFPSAAAQAVQRLSSTGHWIVPIRAPGGNLDLMVWAGTTPVFDGAEDRNGLRARDELRLWTHVLDGRLGSPPGQHFIIAGLANLDPHDGAGDSAAMAAFLADPRLQDPRPASSLGAARPSDPGQTGPPALDTAVWDGPGALRVAYVLPAAAWQVTDAGVHWPPDAAAAGPHRLVWVDLLRD